MGGRGRLAAALTAALLIGAAAHGQNLMVGIPLPPEPDTLANMAREFPDTDFSRRTIDLVEIIFDGNIRDLISSIDAPRFKPVGDVRVVGNLEPVLSLAINGDARAYPLRILLFHEIVNDVVGGVPVLVSYCPLCNSGVVYRRTLDGEVLEFANTGRLRHHDMVMYDRATESWWQQFTGEAIIGELAGRTLELVPARLESLARFRARVPDGKLLVPNDVMRQPYGLSPYEGMERMTEWLPPPLTRDRWPWPLPEGVGPLERVVIVGERAWTLAALRRAGRIEAGDLVLTWQPGQNSLHDETLILAGRDVGNVTVQRDGVDVAYDVAFAFAFAAFRPDGELITK